MNATEVRSRLEKAGRTILWLADKTGYHSATIYNALSKDRFPRRLAKEIERVLAAEEAGAVKAIADDFTEEERQAIEAQAIKDGFATGNLWILDKIRFWLAWHRPGRRDPH